MISLWFSISGRLCILSFSLCHNRSETKQDRIIWEGSQPQSQMVRGTSALEVGQGGGLCPQLLLSPSMTLQNLSTPQTSYEAGTADHNSTSSTTSKFLTRILKKILSWKVSDTGVCSHPWLTFCCFSCLQSTLVWRHFQIEGCNITGFQSCNKGPKVQKSSYADNLDTPKRSCKVLPLSAKVEVLNLKRRKCMLRLLTSTVG